VPQGNGIRRSKDLRARVRKFLILTNERKKMSTKTLRKRIALVAVTALTAGVLSVVAVPSANAANTSAADGTVNGSLMVATDESTQPAAALATADAGTTATSKGLLYKDTSSGLAQSAVVLTGGQLSFYAEVSTAAALSATGGTFSGSTTISDAGVVETYNTANTATIFPLTSGAATYIATLWTAPVTAGVYTVSLLTGFSTNAQGVSGVPTASLLPPTLGAFITVSVVAASAGGTYSASTSICQVSPTGASSTYAGAGVVDSTAIFANGVAAYINYDLNDAYGADLDSGNITVTSTNGALVNVGAGGSLTAGTTTTDIFTSDGSSDTVRVDQGTANAPVTTTVSISYNGTVVCTKTITIRGAVAKLTVENIGTQALSAASTVNGEQWMAQQTTVRTAGQFTVVATDSAGNVVDTTTALGTYAAASGSTSTLIPAITVNTRSSTSTATSASRYNFGGFSCGATAGEASVKITFTDSATAKVTTSDAFTARCAGGASTYSVSLDKASYKQGDLAKATVKFLDSKGNRANNMSGVGANTWNLPYMTAIDSTIAAGVGASSQTVTAANGEIVYTFAVGTTTAAVAGTYTGLATYTGPALGVSSTPTYTLSTGGDTTTNADVLKSIVALIASINKQIQALQKLILQRR
jgi:hypothetical protein